jgi:hypothetical protein
VIELLNAGHVLDGLDSGEPEINDFLHNDALAHGKVGYSKTWVIPNPADQQIQGFVTLAASTQPLSVVKLGEADSKVLGGVLATAPFNRVPVVLIAYWGVQKKFQGHRVGNELLKFAFEEAMRVSGRIGFTGIVLEALNDKLVSSYERKGFVLLPYPDPRKRRMMMSMDTARTSLEAWHQAGIAGTATPGTTSPS